MSTVFDIFALALLLASLTMFVLRYLREEPPIFPYLLIAVACGLGNWAGEAVSALTGLVVLLLAAFFFLSCCFYPHFHGGRRSTATENGADSAV